MFNSAAKYTGAGKVVAINRSINSPALFMMDQTAKESIESNIDTIAADHGIDVSIVQRTIDSIQSVNVGLTHKGGMSVASNSNPYGVSIAGRDMTKDTPWYDLGYDILKAFCDAGGVCLGNVYLTRVDSQIHSLGIDSYYYNDLSADGDYVVESDIHIMMNVLEKLLGGTAIIHDGMTSPSSNDSLVFRMRSVSDSVVQNKNIRYSVEGGVIVGPNFTIELIGTAHANISYINMSSTGPVKINGGGGTDITTSKLASLAAWQFGDTVPVIKYNDEGQLVAIPEQVAISLTKYDWAFTQNMASGTSRTLLHGIYEEGKIYQYFDSIPEESYDPDDNARGIKGTILTDYGTLPAAYENHPWLPLFQFLDSSIGDNDLEIMNGNPSAGSISSFVQCYAMIPSLIVEDFVLSYPISSIVSYSGDNLLAQVIPSDDDNPFYLVLGNRFVQSAEADDTKYFVVVPNQLPDYDLTPATQYDSYHQAESKRVKYGISESRLDVPPGDVKIGYYKVRDMLTEFNLTEIPFFCRAGRTITPVLPHLDESILSLTYSASFNVSNDDNAEGILVTLTANNGEVIIPDPEVYGKLKAANRIKEYDLNGYIDGTLTELEMTKFGLESFPETVDSISFPEYNTDYGIWNRGDFFPKISHLSKNQWVENSIFYYRSLSPSAKGIINATINSLTLNED